LLHRPSGVTESDETATRSCGIAAAWKEKAMGRLMQSLADRRSPLSLITEPRRPSSLGPR
jgi:hypothetical protein